MKTFTGFFKTTPIIFSLLFAHLGYAQSWQWAEEIYFTLNYNGYYNAWSAIPTAVDTDSNGNTYMTGYVTLVIEDQINVHKEFLFLAKFNSQGNVVWKKIFGNTIDANSSQGTDLVVDGAGNIYVTGSFRETLSNGFFQLQSAGGNDIFIARFTTQGLLTWWRGAGGSGSDTSNGIAIDDQGNVFITGSVTGNVNFGSISSNGSSQDFFLAKYNPSGTPQTVNRGSSTTGWSKGTSISYDHAGNVSVLGQYSNNITLDNTTFNSNVSKNFFMSKFGPSDNLLWAKKISGNNILSLGNINTDLSGNTLITGSFYPQVNIGGYAINTPDGYDDSFVAKYGPTGNKIWIQQMGITNAITTSESVSTDADGNVYITGFNLPYPSSHEDLFVRKYNANGGSVWTKTEQYAYGDGYATSRTIECDDDGNCYVAGFLRNFPVYFGSHAVNSSPYDSRGFVAKLAKPMFSPKLFYDEEFICFPCFPFEFVQDYEYKFWSERATIKGATYRKVSDRKNQDEIIWKEDYLEIQLHDQLGEGKYFFQLRAIMKDGTLSEWTDALAFEAKGDGKTALVYPNPVREKLTLEYKTFSSENILLTLFDRNGKVLLQQERDVSEGKNVLELAIPLLRLEAFPLSLQLKSRLQGTMSWQLMGVR